MIDYGRTINAGHMIDAGQVINTGHMIEAGHMIGGGRMIDLQQWEYICNWDRGVRSVQRMSR